jgi:hypothetical protein
MVELVEKASSSYFWVFGKLVALTGKHGFAEKLHLKLKWLLMRLSLFRISQCGSLKHQECIFRALEKFPCYFHD